MLDFLKKSTRFVVILKIRLHHIGDMFVVTKVFVGFVMFVESQL